MKTSLSAAIGVTMISITAVSCGNGSVSSLSVIESDTYSVGNTLPVETILDARLRAQSPVYQLNYIHGTMPSAIGLFDPTLVTNTNGYLFIAPMNALIFKFGKVTTPEDPTLPITGAIIDSVTNQEVGSANYTAVENSAPVLTQISELCSGAFEDTCTIKYNIINLKYALSFTQKQ